MENTKKNILDESGITPTQPGKPKLSSLNLVDIIEQDESSEELNLPKTLKIN